MKSFDELTIQENVKLSAGTATLLLMMLAASLETEMNFVSIFYCILADKGLADIYNIDL